MTETKFNFYASLLDVEVKDLKKELTETFGKEQLRTEFLVLDLIASRFHLAIMNLPEEK